MCFATQRRPPRVFRGSSQVTYTRSEEHTSELQSRPQLVCRLLLEKKNASPDACCLVSSAPCGADVATAGPRICPRGTTGWPPRGVDGGTAELTDPVAWLTAGLSAS